MLVYSGFGVIDRERNERKIDYQIYLRLKLFSKQKGMHCFGSRKVYDKGIQIILLYKIIYVWNLNLIIKVPKVWFYNVFNFNI